MYIKSLSFGNKKIEFNNNVNIISGYTGKNKTLLFYAFEYLFCIDSTLGIDQAKTALKSDYISAVFGDEESQFELKRFFLEKFAGSIDGESFINMKQYKSAIAKKFNFNEIFIDNSNQKNQFFLKDYLKIMLIPEEQLTSLKNIFERNGEMEKNKIKLFFEYMMTGNTLPVNLINKSTKTSKNNSSITKFKTTFNRIYSKPKKNEIAIFNKCIEENIKIETELEEEQKKLNEKFRTLESLNIANKRLMLLLESYNQDLKEFGLAKIFEEIESHLEENVTKMDYEYYSAIQISINDISNVKKFNDKSIVLLEEEIKCINNRIIKLKNKRSENEKKKSELNHVIEYNNMISLTTRLEEENERIIDEIQKEITKEKKKITVSFKDNIKELCENISKRILSWGILDIKTVEFDHLTFDFKFNGSPIKIQPKGEKSIFSLAVNIEILLHMINIGITIPKFIVIDSCWVASDLSYITQENLKSNIVKNLSKLGVQVVIMENEDRKQKN